MKKSINLYVRFIFGFLVFSAIAIFAIVSAGKLIFDSVQASNGDNALPMIIIDAGHGGRDGGAQSADGTLEKDLNLAVSLKLAELFRAGGFKVVLTRATDIELADENSEHKKLDDLQARLNISSEYENSILISIHMNKFVDSRYSGLQVFYSKNNPESQKVAVAIQEYCSAYLQKDNEREVKQADSGIYLLYRITSPAVLVECGFLSNEEECERLKNDEYQKQLAAVIYAAAVEYTDKSAGA